LRVTRSGVNASLIKNVLWVTGLELT
jgi:hypothetical protein